MPVSRRALEIAAALIAAALLGFMLWRLAGLQGMTLANGQPLFGDFIAFWSAGRATLDGNIEQIHDRHFLYGVQQAIAPGVAFVAPWNSPPPFLFVACVLALMPYPVAAVAFFAATLALFLWAMRGLLPDARALIFPASAPVTIYQAGTVQAGLLIAGVSGLALAWLDKRPRLAGAMVALLAIKPHLAVLWPLMLALSGRWRVFWAAALATTAFVAAAGLVFGFDAYGRFLDNLAASQDLISAQRITTPAYASLYANLLSLGAPQALALGAHVVSAAGALVMFGWICLQRSVFPDARSAVRNPGPNTEAFALGSGFAAGAAPRNDGEVRAERGLHSAALCAATLLMSPYLFFYDFTLLLLGAAMLGAPRDRFELAAAVLAWGAGLSVAVGYVVMLPICPAAAWAVLIAALRRRGIAAARPAPAPRT